MAGMCAPIPLDLLGIAPGLRFSVVNHGCKVNRVEADTLASYLLARGAVPSDVENAQLVIVNTCTVTGEADRKARKAVRHALKLAPGAHVIVTGCGAAVNPQEYLQLDERVEVIGRFELIEALKPCEGEPRRFGEGFRTRVNIKIQDGCDNACTYCIVHVARGKARSAKAPSVLAEADAYLDSGAKELVLAGIDLGSYRDGDFGLAELVEALIGHAGLHCAPGEVPARVRASSLEPMTISKKFIELLATSEGRVCRHLHLPLQSGSTRVLREMARPYTAETYESLVDELYARIPGLSLTTDIIVGFPGETDDDFACTLDLARSCRFSKIHVFPYSRRAGTPAAEREDQVDPAVIRQRAAALRRLSDELRARDFEMRKGTSELAIVEPNSALTESYHEIPIPEGAREGSLIPVTFAYESMYPTR